MRIPGLLPLAAAVFFTTSCSLDVREPRTGPPRLRLVNAASATTEVTAHLNGDPDPLLTSAIPANTAAAGCVLILPASHSVSFVEAAATLADVTRSYEVAGKYTVLLVNAGATFRAVALHDAQDVVPGNNGLRFVNATSTAGDVYVTPPGSDPAPVFKAVGNLGPLATSNDDPAFLQRAESDLRIRLYDVGSTTTARADITLPTQQAFDRLTTVVFIDPVTPGDPGAFLVYTCS